MKGICIFLLGIALCAVNHGLFAQFRNDITESQYFSEGTVYRPGGKELDGMVNYNFVDDQVTLRTSNGDEKTFTARDLTWFVMEDSVGTGRYYSLPFDVKQVGMPEMTFFYEVYRNDEYMVLAKHLVSYLNTQFSIAGYTSQHAHEKVLQVIYLANREGKIVDCLEKRKSWNSTLLGDNYFDPNYAFSERQAAFMLTNRLEENALDTLSQSNTLKEIKQFNLADRRCFKDFFGSQYKQFDAYVKSNDLNIKTIEGLIRALNFKS